MYVQHYNKAMSLEEIIKYLTRGQTKMTYSTTTVGVPTITNMIKGLIQVKDDYNKYKTIAQKTKQQNDTAISFYNKALQIMDKHDSLTMKQFQYPAITNLMKFYKKCSTIVTKYSTFYAKDIKKDSYNNNFWYLLQSCLIHIEKVQLSDSKLKQISQSSENSQYQNTHKDSYSKNADVSFLLEKIKTGDFANVKNMINEFEVSKRQILSEILTPIIEEFDKFSKIEEQIRQLCGNKYIYNANDSKNISDKCSNSLQYFLKILNSKKGVQQHYQNNLSNGQKLPNIDEQNIKCTLQTLKDIFCETKDDKNRLQQYKTESAKCKWLSQQIQNKIYDKVNKNSKNPITKNVSLGDLFDLMLNRQKSEMKGMPNKGINVATKKYKQKSPQNVKQTQKVKLTTEDYYDQLQVILVDQIKQLQSMGLQQFKLKYQKIIRDENTKKSSFIEISRVQNIVTNVLVSLGGLYQLPKNTTIISFIEELASFKNSKLGKQQQRNEYRKVYEQTQSQIQRLKNENQINKANLSKKQTENQKLQQAVRELSLEINKSKQVSNNMKNNYDSRQKEHKLLQSQIQSLKMKLSDLKAENSQNESKLKRSEHKCTQLESKASNLQAEIEQHQNKVKELFKNSQIKPNFDEQIQLSNIPKLIESLLKLIHSDRVFVTTINHQIYNSKCIARKTLKKQNRNIEETNLEQQKLQIYNAIHFPQQCSHLNVSHIQSISIQSDLFINEEKQIWILGRIAHYFEKSDIDRVSLIYKSNQTSEPTLDKVPNTLLILQTSSGQNLAAYSSLSYCQSVNMEESNAFLISTLSQNVFPIKKDAKTAQTDNDYLIFGNGCIKIKKVFSKQNQQKMSSNFSTKECGIDSMKQESSFVLTGNQTNEVEVVGYEIYQIVFKQEKLIKTSKRGETLKRDRVDENKEKEKMDKLEKDCRLYKEQSEKYKKIVKTLKSKIGPEGGETDSSNIKDERGTVQVQIEEDGKIEGSKQVAELPNKLIELQKSLDKSSNQVTLKQTQIAEKNKVIAEMKKQHSQSLFGLTSSLKKLTQQNQNMKKTLEELNQNSDNKNSKIFNSVEVQVQNNDCEQSINQKETQLHKQNSFEHPISLEPQQGTVEIRIVQINQFEQKTEIESNEQSTDIANSNQLQLEKEELCKNTKLITQNKQIEQKLQTLNQQITAKQSELKTIEELLNKKTLEMNEIQISLSQKVNEFEQLKKEVNDTQIKETESALTLLIEQKRKLEQQTKKVSVQLTENENLLKKAKREIENEKSNLKTTIGEIKKGREEIVKLNENKAKIGKQIKQKQNAVKEQQKKVQQFQAKLEEQQKGFDSAKQVDQQRQKEMQKKVDDQQKEMEKKVKEMKEFDKKTEELQNQIIVLIDKKEKSEKQLNDKNKELGLTTSQLKALNLELQKKKKEAEPKEPKIMEKQKQIDPSKRKQQEQKIIQKVMKQSEEKLRSLKQEYEKKFTEQEYRLKEQQKNLKFSSDIKQNQNCRLQKGISKNIFFIGDIIESSRDRDYLVKQLEIQNNKYVVATKLLFSFPLMKGLDLHNNVNDKAHYIVLVKMQNRDQQNNNFIIALYSQKPLAKQQGPNKGLGFISSVTNQKAFYLSKNQANHPRVTQYHDFYVVFGNSEIKFKINQPEIQFNIGHNFKSFETTPYKNPKVFTGLEDQKSVMECYEIYQIIFDDRK